MRYVLFIWIAVLSLNAWPGITMAIEVDKEVWQEAREEFDYGEDFKDIEEKEPEEKEKKEAAPRSSFSYSAMSGFAKFMTWLIIISIAVLLIYLLAKAATDGAPPIEQKVRSISFDDGELTDEDFEMVLENLQDIDLNSMLKAAKSSSNWNDILRVQFLIIVQMLDDKGAIDWNKAKTNREYLSELSDQLKHQFGELIYIYEYAWFSGQKIEQDKGHWADQRMETFKSNIG